MEVLRTTTTKSNRTNPVSSIASIIELFDTPSFVADKEGRILTVNQPLEKLFTAKKLGSFSSSDPGILMQMAEEQDPAANKGLLKGWVLLIRSGISLPCSIKVIDELYYVGTINTSGRSNNSEGLKILMENDIFGVAVSNHEGLLQSVNAAFCRLIGYSREELLGQDLSEYFENNEKETNVLEKLATDPKFNNTTIDRTLIHKKGHPIHIIAGITRWEVDKFNHPRFVLTFNDQSANENAEKAIHESEEKLKAIFANSRDGIAVVDILEKNLVSINPSGCSIFEMSPENIPLILSPNEKGKKETHQNLIKWVLEIAGKPNKEGVEQLKGKGGKPKYIKTYKHQLYSSNDRYQVVVYNDVTDDILVREMAVEQENQLKLFVRHIPLPIAMFDLHMNYLLVSEKWNETNPKSPIDLIGKNHYDLNPDLPKRFIESHQKAIKGEIVTNDRDYYVDSDGKGVYLKWETRPWYNSYNEIGGILLVSEDITEKVMSDRVMRNHELRFRSVFESGSVGWLEADIQNTYKYVNDLRANGVTDIDKFLKNLDVDLLFPHFKVINYNEQIGRLFGLRDSDQLKEARLFKMIRDPEALLKRELKAIFNQEQSFDTEFRIINRDGEEKYIHLSVNYPETDDFSRVIYGVLDVTEQREQTLLLRESEERYRTMIENNHLGVIYRNKSTKETLVNDAFVDIFGYTLEEINKLSEPEIMLEDYHEASKAQFLKLKKGEILSYNMEAAYYHKDRSIVYTNTTVTGLYTDNGNFYGTVTMIEDVSEKREIQERLKAQNEELRKINEELDQFVYSAAHDLRAPIANVLGLIKLMKFEEMSETLGNYVDLQETSLNKLDDFIQSIVNYSQNARLELHLDSLDLNKMMNEVLDQYRYLDNAQEMDISLEVKQEGPFISDHKRLTIIMNNIISNAIRYSDSTKLHSYVKVNVTADQNGATLVIEDNGKGIEKTFIDKIFQLFYRADTNSKGTGIGLYLVKETVNKLHGTIEVVSEYMEWTRFTIFLKNLN